MNINRSSLTLSLCVFSVVNSDNAFQFPERLRRARLPFTTRKFRFTDQDEEFRIDAGLAGFLRRGSSKGTNGRGSTKEKPLAELQLPNFVPRPFYNSVSNVHELRRAVLDNGQELRELENVSEERRIPPEELASHRVLELIASRFRSGSAPGRRHENDTHKLALSMEGGGMRGAVTAGMAAAVASLGLCDAFDSIYGSSAGSIVGAYMVSRQMCVDVYTSVLTAARDTFVCKKRLIGGIALSAVDFLAAKQNAVQVNPDFFREKIGPAMNISFVLDGILDEQHGLRPLDVEAFRANDVSQQLRVASSTVQNGKLRVKCFGTSDFFNQTDASGKTVASAARREDGNRRGLFACLEPSMLVPGAAGSPVNLLLQGDTETTTTCFDAFCFQPIPYRSAVEEGATHVLALRSRPEGFRAGTKPGVYETTVAPLYFSANGQPEAAEFFKRGGQQYLYIEDLLTLEEGKNAGVTNGEENGVSVPPAALLYGAETDEETTARKDRGSWKRAHLLPISVPRDTPELGALEQGRDEVMAAVRGGYAAAFDILAPAIGLDIDPELTGERVAELMFPNVTETVQTIMTTKLLVSGVPIGRPSARKRRRKREIFRRLFRRVVQRAPGETGEDVASEMDGTPTHIETKDRCRKTDATVLLSSLPGMQGVPNLAQGLILSQGQAASE